MVGVQNEVGANLVTRQERGRVTRASKQLCERRSNRTVAVGGMERGRTRPMLIPQQQPQQKGLGDVAYVECQVCPREDWVSRHVLVRSPQPT